MRHLATRPSAAHVRLLRSNRSGTRPQGPGRRPRTARTPAGRGSAVRYAGGLSAEVSLLDHRRRQTARRQTGHQIDPICAPDLRTSTDPAATQIGGYVSGPQGASAPLGCPASQPGSDGMSGGSACIIMHRHRALRMRASAADRVERKQAGKDGAHVNDSADRSDHSVAANTATRGGCRLRSAITKSNPCCPHARAQSR